MVRVPIRKTKEEPDDDVSLPDGLKLAGGKLAFVDINVDFKPPRMRRGGGETPEEFAVRKANACAPTEANALAQLLEKKHRWHGLLVSAADRTTKTLGPKKVEVQVHFDDNGVYALQKEVTKAWDTSDGGKKARPTYVSGDKVERFRGDSESDLAKAAMLFDPNHAVRWAVTRRVPSRCICFVRGVKWVCS